MLKLYALLEIWVWGQNLRASFSRSKGRPTSEQAFRFSERMGSFSSLAQAQLIWSGIRVDGWGTGLTRNRNVVSRLNEYFFCFSFTPKKNLFVALNGSFSDKLGVISPVRGAAIKLSRRIKAGLTRNRNGVSIWGKIFIFLSFTRLKILSHEIGVKEQCLR